MKNLAEKICKHKKLILIISGILLVFSFIGMNLTKINYDILVYLPDDIETIKGQDMLTKDFNMGSYSIAVIENQNSKEILKLEDSIKDIKGVNEVVSLYDVLGTTIPVEMLPEEITEHLHQDNTDLLFITFESGTSSKETLEAVEKIRNLPNDNLKLGGMSSMVLDTMNLSDQEILIYIVIAVILCIIVLELSLDSYLVPILLLLNIGCAIVFNLGSNLFLGEISYITKALVAVLQLGVTTDFSIFLYHSYESKKKEYQNKEDAMKEAIKETFKSVMGSSLTTIAGFLVLCTMQLTLGKDLGIVMAKGVLLGVICVLTLFPSLLLVFDKQIEKTYHKSLKINFSKFNNFIVKYHKVIFIIFILLIIPMYLGYKNVNVYYKMDKSLPETLESISTNEVLKDKFNIISPEIILLSNDVKPNKANDMINEIKDVEGVDFVLSFSELQKLGVTENMLPDSIKNIFKSDKYQMLLLNSEYEVASDELNSQVDIINKIVKKYDSNSFVAGEGPLMKDLITISDTDFNNVNISSIVCILVILFIVLNSASLPILLIIAIETAIFINMSVSYFTGVTLPFVGPIVLGTIQLGATIDYAILLTTTYLSKRREGIPKKDAMKETLDYNEHSIFLSGLCFFAATFGVGVYSKLEMVGSLCTLISRGAIISMITVVTALPSILLIFDKLIMKTTKGSKDKMKNIVKKSSIAVLALTFSMTFIPQVNALSKDETVYAKLNNNGEVKHVYVNEQLINNEKLETIEDYTELKNILNINGDETYKLNKNTITWNAQGKDIFYQGNIDKELPIKTNITYKLNGEEKQVKDMLGKKGKVTITIKYTNEDKHTKYVNGQNKTLYTPFVVTLGTVIPSKDNTDITVTNAKIVRTGTNNLIVGLAVPGLYESLDLDELKGIDEVTIEYETTSFELNTIYTVATPKLLDSSDLKIFNELDNITSKVNLLQENMNLIDESTKKLNKGSNELKTKLYSSIKSLKEDKSQALTDEQLEEITNQIMALINNTFTDEYKQQIEESTWQEVLQNMNPNDSNVISSVTNNTTNAVISYLQSVNEYNDYINCETGKTIVAQGGSMSDDQLASCNVIANDKALPYIKEASVNAATNTAKEVSQYVAEKTSKEVASKVALTASQNTVKQVTPTLASDVANNVKKVSLEKLTTSLNSLYNGVEQLDTGIQSISEGITKFNNEGIKNITQLVNNKVIPTSENIKALTELSNDYKSINGNSLSKSTTKFILVVDKEEQKQTTKTKTTNKANETFIERVKNLFK